MSSLMIGVDVGGTFTDIFVLNEAAGTARVAKVPTTRPDQSAGFLDGIKQEVSDFSQISVVVHGTTAGTNALLERKGAKTGVICTPLSVFYATPPAEDSYVRLTICKSAAHVDRACAAIGA